MYTDDVNIMGGSVGIIKKNAEALIVASKESGLEVKADKTKYLVISWNQNAGQNHNIKNDKSSVQLWKNDNSSFQKSRRVQIFGNSPNESKLYSEKNYEQAEDGECLLSFSAESFVFKSAIQKYKN